MTIEELDIFDGALLEDDEDEGDEDMDMMDDDEEGDDDGWSEGDE